MNTFFKAISFMILLTGLFACTKKEATTIYSSYKPILMDKGRITTELFLAAPRPNNILGQMRRMGDYMLVLDYGQGLHIIDITNPAQPVKKGFYSIPACIDFEVKDNMVYANNYRDFVMIDFSNINQPMQARREANAFDIDVKAPDGLSVYKGLTDIPAGTVIISYEKI